MSPKAQAKAIRDFILNEVREHPRDIATVAAAHFGVSRNTVNYHLRHLVARGSIIAAGRTRARRYEVPRKVFEKTFALGPLLFEDRVWRGSLAPLLNDLPPNVLRICEHGVTEMLNNANDHSEGTIVLVRVDRTSDAVSIRIADNGIGIWEKIARAFGLEDHAHAILELTKGKLTTDRSHHSGEGIFFTSRMFDTFVLLSARLAFFHDPDETEWVIERTDRSVKGTAVLMSIGTRSRRTIRQVFDRFSAPGGDYDFSITHVPVALAQIGEANLVSRSQAKRLALRFDLFEEVILDFKGVRSIGQAFADELFRVFSLAHPKVLLTPINAGSEVDRIIQRARSALALDRLSGDPGDIESVR